MRLSVRHRPTCAQDCVHLSANWNCTWRDKCTSSKHDKCTLLTDIGNFFVLVEYLILYQQPCDWPNILNIFSIYCIRISRQWETSSCIHPWWQVLKKRFSRSLLGGGRHHCQKHLAHVFLGIKLHRGKTQPLQLNWLVLEVNWTLESFHTFRATVQTTAKKLCSYLIIAVFFLINSPVWHTRELAWHATETITTPVWVRWLCFVVQRPDC